MTRRKATIVGVATTEQTRTPDRPSISFAIEAFRAALGDCGLDKADVQGLFVSEMEWPLHGPVSQYFAITNWAAQLGIPIRWFTGAVNSAGTGASAVLDASIAIESGQIETAAIIVGRSQFAGTEKTADYTRAGYPYSAWTGSYTAAQFALVAKRHMHVYDTRPEHFARAAATIRNYGNLNPDAVMYGGRRLSVEDVLESPLICDPLTRLMCCPTNSGGAAIILSTKERARDLGKIGVEVLGGADQLYYPAYAEAPLLEQADSRAFSNAWVAEGFARAGIVHDDIDVVQLYDSFASQVVTQWEMMGFCGPGEGGDFIETGAMALDGRFPTCTDGGLLSFSQTGSSTLFRVIEAVRQLRGEVKDHCPHWEIGRHTYDPLICRAVKEAEIGLAVTSGPPTGGGNFVILARGQRS